MVRTEARRENGAHEASAAGSAELLTVEPTSKGYTARVFAFENRRRRSQSENGFDGPGSTMPDLGIEERRSDKAASRSTKRSKPVGVFATI